MAKDHGTPSIENQVLVYPITDSRMSTYGDFPDARSPALTASDMRWFIQHYFGSQDTTGDYASPLLRGDLSGLPSALMITAEYDILSDQCNAYANRLKESGVKVNSQSYPGMIHGFFTLPDAFQSAHDAINRIGKELT
jgi:acetyl esterase